MAAAIPAGRRIPDDLFAPRHLPELRKISPELRQVVLFDRAATAKDLGPILVLNTAGDVTLDSRTLTPRTANFADRDFFRVHQARADRGLFISAP